MTPTRITTLLAVAIAAGVAVWLGLHFSYSDLPPLPWTAVPTLGLLALAELLTALNTRARIRGAPGTRFIEPMVVARLAMFGKASAYTAAVATGTFTGVLVYVAPDLARGVGRHDAIVSAVTLGVALFLAGTALFLEYCCRVPKPPDEKDPERRTLR